MEYSWVVWAFVAVAVMSVIAIRIVSLSKDE